MLVVMKMSLYFCFSQKISEAMAVSMNILRTLTALNNLDGENRRSRLQDTLKQQELFCNIEEIFCPIT